MRTYLVTGGAGFIGSNYIHYMFDKYGDDIRIINVDKLTYAGNLEILRVLKEEIIIHLSRLISVIKKLFPRFLQKMILTGLYILQLSHMLTVLSRILKYLYRQMYLVLL